MGRVPKQVDMGEPGKFYFSIPIEQNIAPQRKRESAVITYPPKDPVNLYSMRVQTNCRLLSSKNNANHKCPEKIAYLLGEHPTAKEIMDYHDLMHAEGFGERAIVARKWAPMSGLMIPNSWGVVLLEHRLERSGVMAKFSPYSVRWIILGEIESAWAEDLVLIHPALDSAELTEIFETQGMVSNDD